MSVNKYLQNSTDKTPLSVNAENNTPFLWSANLFDIKKKVFM